MASTKPKTNSLKSSFICRREETRSFRAEAKAAWVAQWQSQPGWLSRGRQFSAGYCRVDQSGFPLVFLRDTSHCPFRPNINTYLRACDRCLLSAICRFSWWRSGMANGKGQSKDLIKRVVELGTLPTSPDLSSLRSGIMRAVAK